MTSKQPPEDLQSLKAFHTKQRAALRALKSFKHALHPADVTRSAQAFARVQDFIDHADAAVMDILAEAFGAELPPEGLQDDNE